jgi:hypothetical protein
VIRSVACSVGVAMVFLRVVGDSAQFTKHTPATAPPR